MAKRRNLPAISILAGLTPEDRGDFYTVTYPEPEKVTITYLEPERLSVSYPETERLQITYIEQDRFYPQQEKPKDMSRYQEPEKKTSPKFEKEEIKWTPSRKGANVEFQEVKFLNVPTDLAKETDPQARVAYGLLIEVDSLVRRVEECEAMQLRIDELENSVRRLMGVGIGSNPMTPQPPVGPIVHEPKPGFGASAPFLNGQKEAFVAQARAQSAASREKQTEEPQEDSE